MENKQKYINPFTDFGFKKLFGEEANKLLLIDFLNNLLQNQEKIVDITYLQSENLGDNEMDRKAIFDLKCQNEKGEDFIIEMQKAKQKYFKDRSFYYTTFPIQAQAKKDNKEENFIWNYKLKKIYFVAILDFNFGKVNFNKVKHTIMLKDIDTNTIFYDKLQFIYLEMPNFNKSIDELDNDFDKWLYVLKHLPDLDMIPEKLKTKIFMQAIKSAEIATFTKQEKVQYEESLKYYRDLKNSFDTAFEEGEIKGKIEGKLEGKIENSRQIAINLINKGFDSFFIAEITNLTIEEIEKIRKNFDL